MPTFGGMSPFPRRFGGGRTRVQMALEGLNADRGDAYTTDRESIVYVENMAIARAIAAAWGTNARLGNMWVPLRMSDDVLVRWEKILSLAPAPTDTAAVRRRRVLRTFERFGDPAIAANLSTLLEEAIGDAFVAIEYIDVANAYIQVPDGSYSFGVVGTVPWSSTTAHIMVRLQKPTGWTEGDFYEAAAMVGFILEPELPIYTTFEWYRPGPVSTPISGGPSAAGFYLDDEANLDNQIFDV